MKLALVGTGRMGRAVEALALERGHDVVARFNTQYPLPHVLLDGLSRKTRLETETQHQPIDPRALHVTASRLGSVFGEHTVYLDSPFDTIALSHQAKNR